MKGYNRQRIRQKDIIWEDDIKGVSDFKDTNDSTSHVSNKYRRNRMMKFLKENLTWQGWVLFVFANILVNLIPLFYFIDKLAWALATSYVFLIVSGYIWHKSYCYYKSKCTRASIFFK